MALRNGAALRWSQYDVTQQALWRSPCGIRKVIQKRSQLYKTKSNIYGTIILYCLSMSSSTTLSIHLLCIFFSVNKHLHNVMLCVIAVAPLLLGPSKASRCAIVLWNGFIAHNISGRGNSSKRTWFSCRRRTRSLRQPRR